MGNNGPLYGEDMEAIQKATADVGELFLITDHAPVSWVEESNHALAEAAEDWPHTTLIDWAPIAAAHEDELWDGIHLKPSAAALYARWSPGRCTKRSPIPAPAAGRARLSGQPSANRSSTSAARARLGGRGFFGDRRFGARTGSGTRTTTSSIVPLSAAWRSCRADRDGRDFAGQFARRFVGHFADQGRADIGGQPRLRRRPLFRPQPDHGRLVDAADPFTFFIIARYLVPASETLISCALFCSGKARSSYLSPPPARSWTPT